MMNDKQILVDQTRTFAVVLGPEEEGGFTMRVPSVPEIVTYGKNEDEALTDYDVEIARRNLGNALDRIATVNKPKAA